MKYFTPELYVEFNSDDPGVADRAEADWEKATAEYHKHVRKISRRLTGKTRELAESTCLHDAAFLGYLKVPVPKSSGELAVVAAEKGDDVLLLIYVLAEEPSLSEPHQADVFSDIAVLWLYDEVDVTDRGVYSHDILSSNGRVLSVKFVAFDMLSVCKDDFDISRPDRIPAALS
jgi:hypothetical protein